MPSHRVKSGNKNRMSLLAAALLGALVMYVLGRQRVRRGQPFLRAPRMQEAVGIAILVVAVSVNVYAIENTSRVNSSFYGGISAALHMIGYVGSGVAIGQWWASLLLPLLAILVALPAGENPSYEGDIHTVAFLYVFLLPIWIALVAIGVGIRKLAERIRSRRSRPRPA
jgi:cytochrome c biogenesis protein CcdA